MESIIQNLYKRISEENHKVDFDEAMKLYSVADSNELFESANNLRKKFCPSTTSVCSIINAKQGRCSENCKYCAQSAWWKTDCPSSDVIDAKLALEKTKYAAANKISRLSLVTAGKGISGPDFEKVLECFKTITEGCPQVKLCASLGIISYEQMLRLKEVGVVRYHHNIECCESYYPNICTSHSYGDRIKTLQAAKKAELELCCGGIIGLGEGRAERVKLALALREIGPQSIPINILSPIKGTPLENAKELSKDEILRTIAVFRFIMPAATLRTAAGRKKLGRNGIDSFKSGANALISGDFLTIEGSSNDEDLQMLEELGFQPE